MINILLRKIFVSLKSKMKLFQSIILNNIPNSLSQLTRVITSLAVKDSTD